MIPWGNAYFATQACGGTPFSHQTMACWYQHCVQSSADDDEECFAGQVIYQHGAAEGELNQWESCVDHEMGLDAAVEFAECVEGPNLDAYLPDVTALVESCLEDVTRVRDCVETRGKALEVANAKQTPQHPGVPWVLVDGQPVDDPLEIKTALCQALAQSARPPSCDDVEKDNGASLRYVN